MCVIVDTNLASRVFRQQPEADFKPILDWLARGTGVLVFGGRLAEELSRAGEPNRYIFDLLRAGSARRIADEEVQAEELTVDRTGHCRSNDRHVIALARVSGARTLCTHDKALQQDFRNRNLLSAPRGSIYQRAEHAHLLKHTTSCGRLLKKRR